MKNIALLATVFGAALISLPGPASALEYSKGKVTFDKIEEYQQCDDWDIGLCQDALSRWVDAHPADAFKAGKMSRVKMNAWLSIPFFSKAFEQKIGDCKDEDVKLGVASAVGLPQDKKEIIDQAKKIGFELCYADLKDSLVEAVSTPDGQKNICRELLAKGALTGLRMARCKAVKE